MSIKDLVAKARSYRRFQENRPVELSVLLDLLDAARITSCTGNQQNLRYALSVSPECNARLFSSLRWAAQLKDWKGPQEGERPAAYIVIGGDMASPKGHQVDLGIAAQTIQLGLAEQGIGCCMLANINPASVHEVVGFPENVAVLLVLAIGYPAETVVLDSLREGGTTNYWRDENDVHHVPKRPLAEVLLATFK